MKIFLLKLSFISLILVGFCYALDWLINEGLRTSNYKDVSKWNEVISGGIDSELLIVGSSRALVHYDCEIIEKIIGKSCYNLGFDAANYEMQKIMLNLYLKSNSLPKEIIWTVDFQSFQNKDEFYGFEQLIPYQDKEEVKELLKLNKGIPSFLYEIPVIRYTFNPKMKFIGILNYLELKTRKPVLVKGYRKSDLEWDGKFEKFKDSLNNNLRYQFDEVMVNDFQNELRLLTSRGSKINVVIAPIYFEAKEIILNSDSILNSIESLCNESNINFFDFTNDSICFNKDMFYNGNHLNSKGAELFSEKISTLLKMNDFNVY